MEWWKDETRFPGNADVEYRPAGSIKLYTVRPSTAGARYVFAALALTASIVRLHSRDPFVYQVKRSLSHTVRLSLIDPKLTASGLVPVAEFLTDEAKSPNSQGSSDLA